MWKCLKVLWEVNLIPFDKLIGKPIFGQSNIMGIEMVQGVDNLPWISIHNCTRYFDTSNPSKAC